MAATNVCGVTIDKFTDNTAAAGSTKTLTAVDNNNQTILLDTATGSVVTLPAATGSGAKFKFVVSLLATTASHKIQVANSTDVITGLIQIVDINPDTMFAFASTGTSDTITLNRSTTGSCTLGEWVELFDLATNTWTCRGMLSATGTPATPWSAAV